MKRTLAATLLFLGSGVAASALDESNPASMTASRIVSLDYCADQFALSLLPRHRIQALSKDSTKEFSYMRAAAVGIAQVRPIAEDVIQLKPDLIIRSYGGGPNAKHYFTKLGIPVLQLGYTNSIASIQDSTLEVAKQLGVQETAQKIIEDMDHRIANLPSASNLELLYVTPGGVTGGQNTLVDSMIDTAGYRNYQTKDGWQSLPLEALAYAEPDFYATAFYDNTTSHRNFWSSARHPVIRNQLGSTDNVHLAGATTACGGWFIIDAIEQLANKGVPQP